MLLLEHLPDLAHCGCILGLLSGRANGNDAWKSQRESRLIPDHAGGVPRAGRALVGQDLHHHLRLQPDIRHQKRSDSRWFLAHFQPVYLLVELAPSSSESPVPSLLMDTNWSWS